MAASGTKKGPLQGKGWMVAVGAVLVVGALFFADQLGPAPRDQDAKPLVADYAGLRAADVTRAEVRRPKDSFTLVKDGAQWRFESPAPYRANGESVDNWLKGMLDEAEVARTVEGKPGDLAQYGLASPVAQIVLAGRDGRRRTIQIGKEHPVQKSAGFYARHAESGKLFLLSETQADAVKSHAIADLRDRRLLPIEEPKDVRKLEMLRPGKPVVVDRAGEAWKLTQPFAAPADRTNVEDILGQLDTASGDTFVPGTLADPKLGLEPGRLVLRVTDNKGTRGVRFGSALKDGRVHAVREGDTEVMLVSRATFEGLERLAGTDELRELKLVTLEPGKISTIELKNRHGVVRLKKVGDGDWRYTDASGKEAKAKADMVQQVIDRVTMSAAKHVAERPQNLAQYGLQTPAITVMVNDGSGTSQVVQLGKKVGANYYAMGLGAVFEVQDFVYRDLEIKAAAFADKPAAP